MNFVKLLLRTIGLLDLAKKITRYRKLLHVSIDDVLCQDLEFSQIQGFSKKKIDSFPPCQFFQLYLSDQEKAREKFEDWLYEWLITQEAWKVSQRIGGWQNGSLVTSIIDLHAANNRVITNMADAEVVLVKQAISEKVVHYFSVLESIKQEGFDQYHPVPIYCRRDNDKFILLNGHHRVSSLYALGYKNISVVVP